MRFSLSSSTILLLTITTTLAQADVFSSLISGAESLTSAAGTAIGSQTTLLSSVESDINSATSSVGSNAASMTSSLGSAASSVEASISSQVNSAMASATGTSAANAVVGVAPMVGVAGAAFLGLVTLL
jgi:hypothetical protein